jgi:flagellar basal-body rod modification protein FlgD
MTVSSPGAAASGGTTSEIARTRLTSNFNDFLRLLTTQLQNQDPTSPLDTNQFTAQLVQFASVEQQIAINANLERLVEQSRVSQLTQGAGLVGRSARIEATQVELHGGRADILAVPRDSGPVTISIRDASGRVVRSITAQPTAEGVAWIWNGLDNAGARRPDGLYQVAATTSAGVAVPVQVTGAVTGVARGEDGVVLQIGRLSAPLSSLRAVGAR